MKIKKVKTKSIITKSNLPNVDWVINPYIGCAHACIYCYADFMKRFANHQGEDWGSFVDVKENAADTINLKKIKPGQNIIFGSVTDPYQPIEAKYNLTRKCLQKFLEIQPEIEILTKSPLVLKDIELFKKFKNIRVGVSIGTLDEKLAKKLEPGVVSPKKRIETLKKLSDAGIDVFLFVSPIFPEISDVDTLIDLTKDFVGEFLFENINIRFNNRKRIMNFVKENKPELLNFYSDIPKDYWNEMERKIRRKCRTENLKYKIYFHHKI